jgi:hypothetical protein
MSNLQDFIADSHGIKLHRRRVLTAFTHVPDGPVLRVLYSMTRPEKTVTEPVSEKPPKPAAPAIVRRGMVNYRRELYGPSDKPH